MADELQALLDRIHSQGIEKTQAESEKLLAEARAGAERILADAKREAEKILSDSRTESATLVSKGRESLQQAARDTLLSLRKELQDRLATVVAACCARAFDPASVQQLVGELVQSYANQGGQVERVELLVSEESLAGLQDQLLAALGDDLRQRTELKPVRGMSGGIKLVFNGDDVVYDFSDEALASALCAFLNPRLAELVNPE